MGMSEHDENSIALSDEDAKKHLDASLKSMGIDITDDQKNLMLWHLRLVIEKNQHLNLTRITSPLEAIDLHIVDSLLLLRDVAGVEGKILDIGTGAGFPGIPLAIATGKDTVLLDSVGKKIKAVNEFVRTLGLDSQIEAEACRVEEYATRHHGEFGCVVARAVASNATLIEYATPLLRKHGRVVITKGIPSEEEIVQGNAAARICGMTLVSQQTTDLPHEAGHRTIFVYERTGKAAVSLPRAVGKAKSEPLG